jgi:hypothetical protein
MTDCGCYCTESNGAASCPYYKFEVVEDGLDLAANVDHPVADNWE